VGAILGIAVGAKQLLHNKRHNVSNTASVSPVQLLAVKFAHTGSSGTPLHSMTVGDDVGDAVGICEGCIVGTDDGCAEGNCEG
jgi:hypothetical protein